eukprot:364443-Chlamydomonas_euryale.AAC.29
MAVAKTYAGVNICIYPPGLSRRPAAQDLFVAVTLCLYYGSLAVIYVHMNVFFKYLASEEGHFLSFCWFATNCMDMS